MGKTETLLSIDSQEVLENYIGSSYFINEDGKQIFPQVFGRRRLENGQVAFELEKLPGIRWDQLWSSDEHSLSDHLHIGFMICRQLRYLYEQTGLVFLDRNSGNILLDGLQIYQIDLEAVYDSRSGKLYGNNRRNWTEWIDPFYDDRITAFDLAVTIDAHIRQHEDTRTGYSMIQQKKNDLLDELKPFALGYSRFNGGHLLELETVLHQYGQSL